MPRKEYWLDSDDTRTVVRGFTWRAVAYTIAAVILVGGLSWGAWALHVATSGVRGTGNVVIKNNDANNRINSQAYFEQLNGDIVGYGPKLKLAIKQEKQHPGDDFYIANYTGLYNTCVQAVTDYNAASAKTLFRDWKTADLPQQIDVDTACPSDDPTN